MLLIQRIQAGIPVSSAAEAAGVSRRTASKWKVAINWTARRRCWIAARGPIVRLVKLLPSLSRRSSGCADVARQGLRSPVESDRALPRWPASWLERASLGSRTSTRSSPSTATRETTPESSSISTSRNWAASRWVIGHRITGNRRQRGRGAGWEFVHVAIDDASRLAYAEVLANERSPTAAAFLRRLVAWYSTHGVTVTGIMTDNGSCYVSRRFASACRRLGLRHLRTRPYRPCTNGKAERFIQTLLRGWAYHRPYPTSTQRPHPETP